jgi:hypothetical protein
VVCEEVRHCLGVARRGFVLRSFVAAVFMALPVALVLLAAALYARRAGWGDFAVWPVAGFVAWAAGALVVSFGRWRDDRRTAAKLDHLATTKDRFLTACEFEVASSPTTDAAMREIARFAGGFACDQLGAWPRVPSARLGLAVLALAAAAFVPIIEPTVPPELPAAESLLEKAAAVARELANSDPTAEAAAREMEEKQRALARSDDPLRDALRAIAEFEQSLGTSAARPLNPTELASLAAGLAVPAPNAAEAIERGNPQDAASEVAQLDEQTLREVLDEAAAAAASERLRRMAEQNAPRELSQALRASGARSDARRQAMASLQALKSPGSTQQGKEGPSAEGTAAQSETGEESANADGDTNEGRAGSERDRGEGSELDRSAERQFGARPNDDLLGGIEGDGASDVHVQRGEGSLPTRATTGTRETLDAAANAALEAVRRENIPPGSARVVKRYFDNLRSTEPAPAE